MNAVRASAIAHIRQYPVATLDAGTLRILHENCTVWLAEHERIDAGIVESIAAGHTKPEALDWWRDSEREDKEAAQAAQSTIMNELTSRGLGL